VNTAVPHLLAAILSVTLCASALAQNDDPVVVVVNGETISIAVVDPTISGDDLAQVQQAAEAAFEVSSPSGTHGHYIITLTDPPALWRLGSSPPSTPSDAASVRAEGPRHPRAGLAAMLIAGAALTTTGAILAAAGSSAAADFEQGVARGELYPFPGPGDPHPEANELYRTWQTHTRTADAGLGLLIGGGALLGISIPIGLTHERRQQVSLSASIQTRPTASGASSTEFDGLAFSVTLR